MRFGYIIVGACILFVVSPLAAGAGSDSSTNLAPNPGLETADGRGPAFWTQRTPTDDRRILTWDAEVRRAGRRSLKIENHAAVLSRWRTGHLRDMSLEVGSPCRLTAWIRTEGAKGGAGLRLYCLRSDGGIIAQPQSKPITGTAPWTQAELSTVVPADTAYVMIYAELNGTGVAWFDDVSLTGKACPPSAEARAALRPYTIAPEDFEPLEGYVRGRRHGKAVIELPAGVPSGRATAIFWGESARYDVVVTAVDESDGASSLKLLINGDEAARWKLADTPATTRPTEVVRDKVLSGVDVQRRSRVTLEGRPDAGECARICRIRLRPAGRFAGEFLPDAELRVPPTLRLYVEPDQRRRARGMLPRLISGIETAARDKRDRELAALPTPQGWRDRQARTRARFAEIFGDFEPRCPLRPRIVGKIDRPDYVIEKLIFESHPRYFCTANVYVPKRRPFPQPGVLFTCGHAADGKAYHLYHEACLGLALKGYVVLALDPMGQGERSEYFDPKTGKHLVRPCVPQHHYLGRPSWLVGRTLAGYRTWDCIRALDYLISRSEVDAERIAAVGNSGGGIMALLITAVDARVRVCAAAHPGGSMEQTYLTGQWLTEADLLDLIPPRPCLIIVGRNSGEEPGHRRKLDEMRRACEGLGVEKDRVQLALVDGVHDMKKPKREAAYAWLNRWFGRQDEGGTEPALTPETVRDLHCSKTGYVVRDLGGKTGQMLNAERAERLRPPRAVPADAGSITALRDRLTRTIARRIGLNVPKDRDVPAVVRHGSFEADDFSAEKFAIASAPGIHLPSLLMLPKRAPLCKAVVLHVAELGKPVRQGDRSLALALARAGCVVLSIDVRGAGETDPRDRSALKPLTHYDASQFRFDSCAVRAVQAGTTMPAMRTLDVIRATDYLAGRAELTGRPIVLVGEGLGGVWSLMACAFDRRPAAVVCVNTVPSYKLIVGSSICEVRDYYWLPGALSDFDLADLPGLIAPRPALLLDAVDATLKRLSPERCSEICAGSRGVYGGLGVSGRLRVVRTPDGTTRQLGEQVAETLAAVAEAGARPAGRPTDG